MDTKITLLRGPDRVRRRPAVLFGSDDIEGVQYAVSSIWNIYATEAVLGHCTQLSVLQDGAFLDIRGNDRGIYLGQDTKDDALWENIFCQLYASGAYAPDESGYSLGLFDSTHHVLYGENVDPNTIFYPETLGYTDLCALQFSSKTFDVEVNRNGCKSTLHFEKGINHGGICHSPTQDQNGTAFRFCPDREVFKNIVLPAEFFRKTLGSLAMLCPGLTCHYENSQTGTKETFCYPEGVSSYAASLSEAPVFYRKLEAKGKDRYNRAEYAARVEIAISFTPNAGSTLCLHNFRELSYGGTHLEQLDKQLCNALNFYFARETPLGPEAYKKHFTIVLATFCSPHKSDWSNGARNAIRNKMITDMTEDAMYQHFENYLYQNKEIFSQFIASLL